MLQGQLHLSLYHFELVAHVVVLAGKLHGRHAAVIAGVLGHGVGQLDLTAGTGFGMGQQVVDLRGEQHAAQDGIIAELLTLFGLFDHVIHKEIVVVDGGGL